ncbi:MAG TPA: hypothetical protein PKG62_00785, partial [Methanothrix soehngenii]|nr:hypothetical protein [Methanothrix soehngenii]
CRHRKPWKPRSLGRGAVTARNSTTPTARKRRASIHQGRKATTIILSRERINHNTNRATIASTRA